MNNFEERKYLIIPYIDAEGIPLSDIEELCYSYTSIANNDLLISYYHKPHFCKSEYKEYNYQQTLDLLK